MADNMTGTSAFISEVCAIIAEMAAKNAVTTENNSAMV